MVIATKEVFQGSWNDMAKAVAAGKICIGKYDPFPRTIDITHKDGSVKIFAQWYFDTQFNGGSRLLIFDNVIDSERVFTTYLNGESENGYGEITSLRISPLSSILPGREVFKVVASRQSLANVRDSELSPILPSREAFRLAASSKSSQPPVAS